MFPNTSNLYTQISTALTDYKKENTEFNDAIIKDVLIVGSVAHNNFKRGESDLDLVVILENSPYKPIVMGFDTYLRESKYQSILLRDSGMPISEVDVGVYAGKDYKNYIEDDKVYSIKYESMMDLEQI